MTGQLLCYLAGPPGVGKSAVMAELTAGCVRSARRGPPAHEALARAGTEVGVEIGVRRPRFPGTDALSMGIHPAACDWISGTPAGLVLGEGARLGTTGFLHAARDAGYQVLLVHLSAPAETLEGRRLARGSAQSRSWIAGATTRARLLAERMEPYARVRHLAADIPAAVLAGSIIALDPALGVLVD